ncbi:MAG: hypothetical protein IJM30_07120 [Thermoguttaceae bacterium]|nr:hypothetical protein [Thermoguttaceae bacterium]
MKLTPIVGALSILLASCWTALAVEKFPTRGNLNLDGVWEFALDPENVGETSAWFSPDVSLPSDLPEGSAPKEPGKIVVPGIWDAQGYGAPTNKVKHNFVGKGWYKKAITVPADWDKNDSIYLTLGGISRSAKVWIDGEQVGEEVVGCIGAHEFNVSEFLKPGAKATIAIRVDSSQNWAIDPLLGAASLNDYLEIKWGGLWGHVWLESRPKTRLDSIYIRTELEKGYLEGSTRAICLLDATILDEAKSSDFSGALTLEIFDARGDSVATKYLPIKNLDLSTGEAVVALSVGIADAKLWSPESPYLYEARATFQPDGAKKDVCETRYGAREIKFDGNKILLNGEPYYLRGYGDDHIYPIEFSMPTDGAMYRERLEIIKSFGFNHCRHHSCVLPHEYYDACDEIGMLPNAEMLLGYPQQLPGEGDLWKRNVPAGTDPKPALDTIKSRWAQVVKEYRNHPSIFAWVGGNELCMLNWDRWLAMPLGPEMKEIAKKLDPARYFTDCDGDFLNEYKARGGREAEDFYSILFDEWSNPVLNQNKFKTDAVFDKPAISHESGNFLTFSRQDQVALFENSNYKPFWMVDGKEKLEKLGLADEVEAWAKASEKLYLLEHKSNVESARKNPDLSGYHWWLIQDYWTTSNGIVDLFFRPKSIRPEDITPFNAELVLLQDGLDFSYRSGDSVEISPTISNYSRGTKKGSMRWSFSLGDLTPARGKIDVPSAPNGQLTALDKIEFVCPDVDKPTKATFRLDFYALDGTSRANSWTTLLFPKEIAPTTQKPVYADETAIRFFPEEWGVKSLTGLKGDLPTDAVYAVAWATPDVIKAVEQGAGLLHFGASQFLGSLPMRFQQTWWKAGDSDTQNNTGTYVYPDSFVADLAPDAFCGASWASLLDGAQKFSLETSQPRPEIAVRALSSLVRVQDSAILFDFKVGKGTVVVSGLNCEILREDGSGAENYTGKETVKNPSLANLCVLARSIDLAANGTSSNVQWDPEFLVPPVKVPEGFSLGLERIVTFAETGVWNSYRDMTQGVPNWVCRQNQVGKEVVWKTAIVPTTDASTVSFLFAGATGYASQPKTAGFALSFNGAELLTFDVVETFDGTSEFVWKSPDGTAALKFVAKTELSGNDKYGVFVLTVPSALVKPGVAQEIAVKSLGEGSPRWFGVNLYSDFSDIESLTPPETNPVPEPVVEPAAEENAETTEATAPVEEQTPEATEPAPEPAAKS